MWPVYIMNKICLIVTQFLMTFCRFSSRIALNNHFYSKFLCFQLNKWSNCRLKEKLIYILTNIYCSKKWSRWSCCSFLLKLIHGFKWAKTKRLLKDRNNFNSIISMKWIHLMETRIKLWTKPTTVRNQYLNGYLDINKSGPYYMAHTRWSIYYMDQMFWPSSMGHRIFLVFKGYTFF